VSRPERLDVPPFGRRKARFAEGAGAAKQNRQGFDEIVRAKECFVEWRHALPQAALGQIPHELFDLFPGRLRPGVEVTGG
jgi:hypothetical protein